MTNSSAEPEKEQAPRFTALIPFIVFVVLYFGLSICAGDFYKISMPVAFLAASASAFLLNRKVSFSDKMEIYARGMGEQNIMIMGLIFILAGAFASAARGMGAVNAAVLIARHLIPGQFMLAGIFLVSCLISVSVGTSCGTIAGVAPIAAGLAGPLGITPEIMFCAVIGGAMFGDNLSMISDTTIAATRTQNAAMRDKFLTNLRIALPAAFFALIVCLLQGRGGESVPVIQPIAWTHILAVVPYLLILVLALCGLNVAVLLFSGTILACGIGILTGAFNLWGALDWCGKGILSLSETLIVALLAGGLLKLIRWNGGIAWLMKRIEGTIRSAGGCELGILLLVGIINLFTANNTVAIVIAGPIAKEIGDKYRCLPKRIASILDTGSCFVQGLIPYGAQILIAVGIARDAGLVISPLKLAGGLWYQWFTGIALLVFILRGKHRI